jgi:hypothetical protein
MQSKIVKENLNIIFSITQRAGDKTVLTQKRPHLPYFNTVLRDIVMRFPTFELCFSQKSQENIQKDEDF